MRVCKITEAVDKMNAELLLISPAIFELGSTHGMLVGDGLKTDKRKYFLYSDNDSLEFVATEAVEADIFNGFKRDK